MPIDRVANVFDLNTYLKDRGVAFLLIFNDGSQVGDGLAADFAEDRTDSCDEVLVDLRDINDQMVDRIKGIGIDLDRPGVYLIKDEKVLEFVTYDGSVVDLVRELMDLLNFADDDDGEDGITLSDEMQKLHELHHTHVRTQVAAQILSGMLANPGNFQGMDMGDITELAHAYAEELIKGSKKREGTV